MNKQSISSRILALLMVIAVTISVAAMPADVYAVSKKKAKKPKITCSITFKNINGDTVIKKGKRLKVAYSAKSSNGKKVKVRFRTSNRRVATVSRNGVIKAKRNGTVKITAIGYIKGRKRGSKTVKIKVGKPVTGISLSGYTYLRAGRSTKLSSAISPSNATNKKIDWSSSNTRAVVVDQNGNITGVGNGSAVITARASDGSGASRAVTVYSHRYTKKDTHWIAHRGLHETATENSEAAFTLAGKAGFWGCECDIWETKHVITETVVEESADCNEELDEDAAEDAADNDVILDADVAYDEAETQSTKMVEDFDIVINHDPTFNRLFGVNTYVNELTSDEIRSNNKLSKVCFFDKYLAVCKQYGMIPIIEIKDYDMSDAGIEKFVGMVNEEGLLKTAQFISFDATVLERTQNYILAEYGFKPYCGYLIGGGNVSSAVTLAKKKGFSGINIAYTLLTPAVNTQCRNYGLKICTWTYNNSIGCDEVLYKHLISGNYNVYSTTADGKFY